MSKETGCLSSIGIILLSVATCVLLIKCGNHIEKKMNDKATIKSITYDIRNIKRDDDNEYHVIASNGDKTLNLIDCYNIYIHYGNYEKPIIVEHLTNKYTGYGDDFIVDGPYSVY